ncbi:MAG: VCBS repeat-containing protein [Balneolaceae bacterium]|nr:VCBS repeat-containing protein [Balneolaceae bacterium]
MAAEKFKSSGIYYIPLLFLCLFTTVSHSQPTLLGSAELSRSTGATYSEGTLTVIAVMAEFQPDENRFTTGKGTFGPGSLPFLEDRPGHIDPLPHNRNYFEAHLEFVRNYFERMSGGQLQIETYVLPEMIQLPEQMEYYSPVGEDPPLNPLAQLATDAWLAVSEKGDLDLPQIDGSQTAFVIFHAGVGRDVELTGTTLDRTPQDIPSVYLSRNAISDLLNDPTFSGIPIDNGNLLVNNSLILPRTLSRPGETVTGDPFVLPLSINGLLTAQIGSHIGLPDLFNTETGNSGIGRFGLMDGAGIFAYNGLIPPEMSAWEKIWMGWEEPVTVRPEDDTLIELPAASLREAGSIVRIPVTADEYFLIENRNRDPQGDGVTLTIQTIDGETVNQTFTNSDRAFTTQESGFDRLLTPGVITNVSNYDFALPGGIFDRDGEPDGTIELNGGFLIWHVDESVIRNKLGREGINNDPNRRAVTLMEADGVQDIGRPLPGGQFQSEVNGTPFDFWWSGNDASVITQSGRFTLYQNRFGPDTTPNNQSHSGAASPFEIYDFSDIQPVASFRIKPVSVSEPYNLLISRDDLDLQTFNGGDTYSRQYPRSLSRLSETSNRVIIPANDGFRLFDLSENILSEKFTENRSLRQPITGIADGTFAVSDTPDTGSGDDPEISIFSYDDALQIFELSTVSIPGFDAGHISISLTDGLIDADLTPFRLDPDNGSIDQLDVDYIQRSGSLNEAQSTITNQTFTIRGRDGSGFEEQPILTLSDTYRLHTGVIGYPSSGALWYLLGDRSLHLFGGAKDQWQTVIDNRLISWPAITDLNGNGDVDFIFTDYDNNRLSAINSSGAVLSNFPIRPPAGVRFTGAPLVADLNGDGRAELLISGRDDFSHSIYLYNLEGDQLSGSPLYVGGILQPDYKPVYPLLIENRLIAVSQTGDLKVWEFPEMGNVYWSSHYGNKSDNNVSGLIERERDEERSFTLLNKEETYNWPNPAREHTMIRFETSVRAEISIKITTLSGRTIYDQTIQVRGGVPEEVEIDTSGWASGAYFGLVTAIAGGETERKLIRIAVAR